jgi:divalent metal cation (Fe/Co/Zn/Cd) transporter
MLDGLEPGVVDQVAHAARHVSGVEDVAEIRVARASARLRGERRGLRGELTVAAGHAIAKEVRHQILHHVPHAASATVHVDPGTEPGERHHRVAAHAHDGLGAHAHA